VTQYIVRQTTVLLAQISTSAGLRSPHSHVANQVFFELARELEAQGVSRNVVADMFGLALRSYQLKMQRLAETAGVQPSLWQDVHERLERSSVSRRELQSHFPLVEAKTMRAILHDLVDSGLAYKSGRGEDTVYGLTRTRSVSAYKTLPARPRSPISFGSRCRLEVTTRARRCHTCSAWMRTNCRRH
jgi:hypothetical protein